MEIECCHDRIEKVVLSGLVLFISNEKLCFLSFPLFLREKNNILDSLDADDLVCFGQCELTIQVWSAWCSFFSK